MPRELDDYYAWEIVEVAVARDLDRKASRNAQSKEQFAAMAEQKKADDAAGQSGPKVLGKKK